jgi:mannosyltransferase OCH1-like enzyme
MSEYRRLMVNKINDDPRWNKMEKLYDNFLKKEIISNIPKIIHLIWLGTLPEHYQKYIDKIRNFHPEWEVKLWNEESIKNWGLMINQDLYNKSDNLASKSDIFRYEVLLKEGGIYLDLDFDMVKPFNENLLKLDFFAGIGHVEKPELFNSLVASKPGGEIIQKIVYGLKKQRVASKTDIEGIMGSTGPYYITKVFFEYLDDSNLEDVNVVIFPTVYFFPYPAAQRFVTRHKEEQNTFHKFIYSYVKPETYCIHLWHTSWQ